MGYGYPPPGYGPPGMPPPMGGMYAGPPTTHPLAITSLVCGILSLPVACCCWMVAPALSITALVCGIIGMNKIKAEPERYTGQGLAITGIVLGGVGTAIGVGTFALGMGNALMDKLR